jgi:DNA-binding CsgD family transcriptional regulator
VLSWLARGNPNTLQSITSAPDYFARVGAVVERFQAAPDQAAALELLQEATCRMGAEVSAFVSFVRDDDAYESYRFLLACDPLWCFEYEEKAWFADDPWLAYAMNHSEPVRGSDIAVSTDGQREVVQLAERYGFRSAVIVPAPSSGGLSRLGLLCLGSRTCGYFEGVGFTALRVVARSLAMEVHEWWIAQVKRELMAEARLTGEDLMLLAHERQGHSTKAIATALSSSPSSIDSRFQRVNAKLGVANRRAAARLAAEYGLI